MLDITSPSSPLNNPAAAQLMMQQVGVVALLQIIDAASLVKANDDDEDQRSTLLLDLRQMEMSTRTADLVVPRSSTVPNTQRRVPTEEGYLRILRLAATILCHSDAGPMLISVLRENILLVEIFLDSILDGLTCVNNYARHWAIKALWMTLGLYRQAKLIHGAKNIATEFAVGITEGLATLRTFERSDYQALLQILLDMIVMPRSTKNGGVKSGGVKNGGVKSGGVKSGGKNSGKNSGMDDGSILDLPTPEVEAFGKSIEMPAVLPLLFDLLLLSDNSMRRDVMKDMNYLLCRVGDANNFHAFLSHKNWQDWFLPLFHRIPHDDCDKSLKDRWTAQVKDYSISTTINSTTSTISTEKKGRKSTGWGKLKGFVKKEETGPDEIQKELRTYMLNVYGMVHVFSFRHTDYSIDRILNTGIERMKRCVCCFFLFSLCTFFFLFFSFPSLISHLKAEQNNSHHSIFSSLLFSSLLFSIDLLVML